MMIDEFDDERTLDEAEAEAAIDGEDHEEEVNNLQKVRLVIPVLRTWQIPIPYVPPNGQ